MKIKIKIIERSEKEKHKNKNSRVEEPKIKSQAAMEYLMTYGWAILIIALVLGVLYSLGIMNPKNFIPRAPPGSCFVFRPNGPGTTDFVSLQGTCGYLPMYIGSFNGVNAYVEVPYFGGNFNQLTVGAWIYPKNYGNYRKIVDFGLDGLTGRRTTLQLAADGISYDVDGGASGYAKWYSTPLNQWLYLVGVWNGTSFIRLYVNGELKAENTKAPTITSLSILSSDAHIIGRRITATDYFNGLLANVQIYSTALTPQEIQYLYQQGLGGGPVRLQNLVGWWPLNGDAKDYSGNNNHGTINGGVTFVQNYNPP